MTTYKCEYCDLSFSYRSNLSRHKKQYHKYVIDTEIENKKKEAELELEKKNLEYEFKIKTYEEKIKMLEEKMKYANEKDKELISEKSKSYEEKEAIYLANTKFMERRLEVAEDLIKSVGGVVASSMSAITYAMINYKDAPALEAIEDYSLVIDNKDNKFVKNLATNYRRKISDKYLGDYLIKYYKKEDPNKQSKWGSDTQRLNYIIREKHNDSVEWAVDKKGIKVIDTVIKPFLCETRNLCTQYMSELNEKIKKAKGSKYQLYLNDTITLAEIVSKINNNTMAHDILKYITPHFYLNKESATA